jgi:hypothetical protein
MWPLISLARHLVTERSFLPILINSLSLSLSLSLSTHCFLFDNVKLSKALILFRKAAVKQSEKQLNQSPVGTIVSQVDAG